MVTGQKHEELTAITANLVVALMTGRYATMIALVDQLEAALRGTDAEVA